MPADTARDISPRTSHPMHSSTDLPLDARIKTGTPHREAVVQDRPTLGSLPRAKRGLGWWLVPAIDLATSSVALIAVALASGRQIFPGSSGGAAAAGRHLRGARRLRRAFEPLRPGRRGRRRLAGHPGAGGGALRLVGLAPDPADQRRAALPLGALHAARHRRPRDRRVGAGAPRPGRAVDPRRRADERRAVEGLRAAAQVREDRLHDPGRRRTSPSRRVASRRSRSSTATAPTGS